MQIFFHYSVFLCLIQIYSFRLTNVCKKIKLKFSYTNLETKKKFRSLAKVHSLLHPSQANTEKYIGKILRNTGKILRKYWENIGTKKYYALTINKIIAIKYFFVFGQKNKTRY